MHLKVVVVLLAVGTLTGLFVAASPARAIASIAMDPPQFHPFYYIPGEQIRFTVSILNTDPRTYDFLVAWDDGATRTNWSGDAFDDVTIAAPQLSIVETFSLPPGIPDGDYYFLEVHDQNWIENNGSGLTYDRQQFSIRTWTLNLEMDRRAYLPGDTVTVGDLTFTVEDDKDPGHNEEIDYLSDKVRPIEAELLRRAPGGFSQVAADPGQQDEVVHKILPAVPGAEPP